MNAPVNLSSLRLFDIADDYLNALEALAEMDDLPPEAIADTLEGLAGAFESKAAHVAAYIRTLEAEAAAIEDVRKAMERRENALQRHTMRLRDYLKTEMERTGLTRMKNTWLTLQIQANPLSVVIEDETMVPERFKQPVTTIKLLKSEIGKALKAGEAVFGARLQTSTRLVIQ